MPGQEALEPGDLLLRRVPPWHMTATDASKPGGKRVNSDAFKDDETGSMSVYVARLLIEGGRNPLDILKGHEGYGLVGFSVSQATERGWRVELVKGHESDPLGFAHALVLGDKKHRSPRHSLGAECQYLHWPPALTSDTAGEPQ